MAPNLRCHWNSLGWFASVCANHDQTLFAWPSSGWLSLGFLLFPREASLRV